MARARHSMTGTRTGAARVLHSCSFLAAAALLVSGCVDRAGPDNRLVDLLVTPDSVTVLEGRTVQFHASGHTSSGAANPVSATWSATGGTIDATGLFRADTVAGLFLVTATADAGTLADTARVTITQPAALVQVVLTPSSATLIPGATQAFVSYGLMSTGDSVAVNVTYSATGGTITAGGLYTAGGTAGDFHVIATQQGGSLADTSPVAITPTPTLVEIVLEPATATTTAGTSRAFTSYGRMSTGDSVAVTVSYTSTGGTITSEGLYTAGPAAGDFLVVATEQGGSLADTSHVTIILGTVLAQVVLVPPSAHLDAGGSQQFAAFGRMSNDDSVAVTVTYAATGGTITAGGLYTAGAAAGAFQVIATQREGTLSDTSTVTITVPPTLAQIVLVPAAVTLNVGAAQQFTTYGRMSNGDSVAVSVTTTATGGTISASGLYTAGQTTGDFRVIATEQGGTLADTAGVTIVAVGSNVVLVGAGDIADCGSTGDEATAALLDSIPGTVFTAGDDAYPDGSTTDFANCYDPSWGRHKARTRPSPGNHDYNTNGAAPYYAYFGDNAGPAGRGYYSYDMGAWHIVSLNSETDVSAGSPQVTWLRADLAATTKHCSIAYWHRPRFSSATRHGSDPAMQPLWQALYEYGAEIVIVGHDHNYERFAPQTPTGAADPATGIREFVAGTGGKSIEPGSNPIPNSEVFDATTFRVLKLTDQKRP